MIDEPGEGPGVERLGHGVPVLLGLVVLERDLRDVAADVDLAEERHLDQILGREPQQGRDVLQERAVIGSQVRGLVLSVLEEEKRRRK